MKRQYAVKTRFSFTGTFFVTELANVYYAESAIAIDDGLEMETGRNIYSRKKHTLKDIHLYELSFKNETGGTNARREK